MQIPVGLKKSSFFILVFIASTAAASRSAIARPPSKTDFLRAYSDHALVQYSAALTTAKGLQTALLEFTKHPTAETQQAAKDAWNVARKEYLPTESFRFANGPIDRDGGPEPLINSWPLDESAIDYVLGDFNAGIINAVTAYPTITADVIASLNQKVGETSVTTGYHAIEFLLWGQDTDPNGAGHRSFSDYASGPTGTTGNRPNADRRGAYLNSAATLLVSNLQTVVDEWNPSQPQAYVHGFLDPKNADAELTAIIAALVNFTGEELSQERMYEEEHSCFSDTTIFDFKYDFAGIQMLLHDLPTGPGLLTLLRPLSPQLADAIQLSADQAEAAIAVIVANAPFDQEILNPQDRPFILDAVTRLEELSTLIKDSASVFNAKPPQP